MLIEEIFDKLIEEISYDLIGTISFDGIGIKWEYDCFNREFDDDIESHLNQVLEEDKELILEYINEDVFEITEPELEDTFIFFYIQH